MKAIAAPMAAIALGAALAACSSSSSVGTATPTPTAGTEILHGTVTGPSALSSNPVFHLTATGLVSTTATIPLGGSPKKGATHIFHTKSGNLAVVLDSSGANTGGLKSAKTCEFAFTTTVPLTVDGTKSTGEFAGASGTGHAVVVFSGNLPRLGNGKCNESKSARPDTKTATGHFRATIKLTVRR
jgi:hypothetical protein